jgi:hypothetical protein
MTAPKSPRDRFRALMESLAEDAAAASDEALLGDAAAERIDAKEEAARVRSSLLAGLQNEKKSRLKQAAEAHERAVRALEERATELPTDTKSRRELMDRALRQRPQMREALTMQFRDFALLSDADVESVLRQLQHLGALDEDESGTKKK